MTLSGLFFNVSGVTRELRFSLWDAQEGQIAVWQAKVGEDVRYFEADVNADIWALVDKAAGCYTEE